MKSMITLATLLLASSVSFAVANCPADTATVKTCTSTPQPGDNEVAAGVFESIAICQKGNQTLMAVEAGGKTKAGEVSVSVRAGGTSYSVTADNVEFTLSVTTGIRPGISNKARLTVNFTGAGLSGSSTYTCN